MFRPEFLFWACSSYAFQNKFLLSFYLKKQGGDFTRFVNVHVKSSDPRNILIDFPQRFSPTVLNTQYDTEQTPITIMVNKKTYVVN